MLKHLTNRIDNTNILSFNYTDIKWKPENVSHIDNVHGRVNGEGNIIFGIDNKNIDVSNNAYKFTKTYRKVYSNAFYPNDFISDNVLSKDIKTIAFYGHSLNKQDYAYFQTIFDFYKIIECKTHLIFMYSIYDSANPDKVKIDIVNNVTALLEEYGNSLNNAQGKNLIHALLNQKKLEIKEIAVSFC